MCGCNKNLEMLDCIPRCMVHEKIIFEDVAKVEMASTGRRRFCI